VADLSHDGGDDGFHEIQLSGKQLVFLFMATTVISVVIFLSGVMVGRGVRAEGMGPSTPAGGAAVTSPPVTGTTAQSAPPSTEAPAPVAEGTLSYPERLQREKPAVDELKPAAESRPRPDPPKPEAPAAAPAPAAASAATTPPAPSTDQGARPGTWVVQLVVLSDRAAASAVVSRLSAKGYPAFLVSPKAGAPVQNYKVQVGRYPERREAEQAASRLKKEEQFEPWILR
jgi:cell division septation protein DedD